MVILDFADALVDASDDVVASDDKDGLTDECGLADVAIRRVFRSRDDYANQPNQVELAQLDLVEIIGLSLSWVCCILFMLQIVQRRRNLATMISVLP